MNTELIVSGLFSLALFLLGYFLTGSSKSKETIKNLEIRIAVLENGIKSILENESKSIAKQDKELDKLDEKLQAIVEKLYE